MSPSPRLKIAHTYQEPSVRFYEPNAAQIHIYHTMRGLQRAGHHVLLLALQGREVLCTQDLHVFHNEKLTNSYYGQTGWSGTAIFKRLESGIRRLQTLLHFPYLALFDSYRMAAAALYQPEGLRSHP